MKRSKKLIQFILLIGTIISIVFTTGFSFSGCMDVELHGIEKYGRSNSSMTLTQYLIPILEGEDGEEAFLRDYQYIEGDYFYSDKGFLTKNAMEKALMYLIYDSEMYGEAKNVALNSFPLSSINRYTYNGYSFIENLAYYNSHIDEGENLYFPKHFNMVAYNDEKNTIIFIGFIFGKESMDEDDNAALNPFNIELFLKTYFPYYDFDA